MKGQVSTLPEPKAKWSTIRRNTLESVLYCFVEPSIDSRLSHLGNRQFC
jgi:hypothetical protein